MTASKSSRLFFSSSSAASRLMIIPFCREKAKRLPGGDRPYRRSPGSFQDFPPGCTAARCRGMFPHGFTDTLGDHAGNFFRHRFQAVGIFEDTAIYPFIDQFRRPVVTGGNDRKAAGQGLQADVGERIVEGREYQEITCPIVSSTAGVFPGEDDPVRHAYPARRQVADRAGKFPCPPRPAL